MTSPLGGECSIQLSYRDTRMASILVILPGTGQCEEQNNSGCVYGGAEEDRTPDLRIANATLSQLSYRPIQ